MRYAITYKDHLVFQHFGKCPSFLLVDIENAQIIKKELLYANGSGHGALVELLRDAGVQTLVCGGIGFGAREALGAVGIALLSGAQGTVDEILEQLKMGALKDASVAGQCQCHGKEHHDCSHHKTASCK